MGKRNKVEDEEHIKKKIRRLEKKLQKIPKQSRPTEPSTPPMPVPPRSPTPTATRPPSPEPEQPVPGPSGAPHESEQDLDLDEDELPEEFLQALGSEGQETTDVGKAIRHELTLRWSRIMCNGLGKEAKETIVKKYLLPENFPNCRAPLMNPEILAAISELTLKRDKRIMARQDLIAKIITCLGKSLTNILKGNLNSKTLIEEMSDAAKLAAEVFYQDSSSRRFFALAGANSIVKEAVRESKPDKFIFGEDCAEKIRAAQAIKKTGTQIKTSDSSKPSAKGPNQVPTIKRQGNWRGPPQHHQHQQQRARGGLRPQPPRKFHQYPNSHLKDQRRNQHKSRPNYRR